MSADLPVIEKDGSKFPWVMDLDGDWHFRPPNDPWIVTVHQPQSEAPNARTVCGREVLSVNVSSYRPEPSADLDESWCPTCRNATMVGCEAGCKEPVLEVDLFDVAMCASCASETALDSWTDPDDGGTS